MAKAAEPVERVQVTIMLDEDVRDTVDMLARAESRSRSRQITVLLREALAARGPARRPVARKREAA
jgi:hypothetical protein